MDEPLGINDLFTQTRELKSSNDQRKVIMAELIDHEGTAAWIPRFVNWLFDKYEVKSKLVLLLLALLTATTLSAKPVKTICVMPIDSNQQVRAAVEEWLHVKGYDTTDCLAHPESGDAVLGFFTNHRTIYSNEFYFYRTAANAVTIIRNAYPATGITIWLQSHQQGNYEGSLFVGEMLYYGRAASLQAGLNRVVKQLKRKEKK